MMIDVERTRAYYAGTDNRCDCDPCQNFYRSVKSCCPALTAFLAERGADAEKPLEVPWYVERRHTVTYNAMYVLCGTVEADWETVLDGVPVFVSPGFPSTGAEEPFFVVEAGPYTLDWILEKPFEEAFPEK